MHETNVVGVLRVTQAFLPMIREDKVSGLLVLITRSLTNEHTVTLPTLPSLQGRVVNIGSILGIVSLPGASFLVTASVSAAEPLTCVYLSARSLCGHENGA